MEKIKCRREKLLHILHFTDTNIYSLYTGHVACFTIPKSELYWLLPLTEHTVFTLTKAFTVQATEHEMHKH